MVLLVPENPGSEIPGFQDSRGSRFQRLQGSRFQGPRGLRFQGPDSRVAEVQGFNRFYGSMARNS